MAPPRQSEEELPNKASQKTLCHATAGRLGGAVVRRPIMVPPRWSQAVRGEAAEASPLRFFHHGTGRLEGGAGRRRDAPEVGKNYKLTPLSCYCLKLRTFDPI